MATNRKQTRRIPGGKRRNRQKYFVLLERLRRSKAPAEQRRLIDDLARLTYGC